ncbi:DUF3099 domain-containing protein [Salinibacterium sp. dk2585]|uniref:DUF3099 domain-containing protein n=1 Tax=unclassified Salinibacterium TaxID=2632331 RepID=UPI0011C25163|nr:MULTISPECIES: DUF3099 domain-containing protein [unclassified Salinibacterium]QEE61214.1 DUF3099 domain-containing protein [Salinibacterium sp. dk2585]TXK53889.1 DUF3099 domain-containing protein [Salinibacterium sp. dk5596]
MAKPQSITSLPLSPDDDRRRRMLRYTIAMSIRVVCLFACFVVPGWWMAIPAIGAIVLPYIAVVVANVSTGVRGGVEAPDPRSVELYRGEGEQ